MTQDLFKLNEEDIIFLDIETVANQKELDENSEEFNLFQWKMRDKNTDELPSPEETKELYERKAALYAVHSNIVCVTLGAVSKGKKIFLRTFKGEEKDVLRQTVDAIVNSKASTLIIWNMAFDMPTIRKRFFANRLKGYLPDSKGNDSMKKPWTLKGVIDLMEVWKGIGFYNESMNEVAWAMGLPSPKEDMRGDEVSHVFYNEKNGIDRIATYNQKDVSTLINIFRVFREDEPIEDIEILDNPKVEKVPVLERIMNFGAITPDDEKELLERAKMLSTSDEKENLVTLVKSSLGKKEGDYSESEEELFDKIRK